MKFARKLLETGRAKMGGKDWNWHEKGRFETQNKQIKEFLDELTIGQIEFYFMNWHTNEVSWGFNSKLVASHLTISAKFKMHNFGYVSLNPKANNRR